MERKEEVRDLKFCHRCGQVVSTSTALKRYVETQICLIFAWYNALWWRSIESTDQPVGCNSENEVDGEGYSGDAEEDVRGAVAEAANGEDEEEEEEGEEEGGENQPGVEK